MKKILLLISSLLTVGAFAQLSVSENQSLISNPGQTSASQRTYNACSYVQEDNNMQDGYQSNTAANYVLADDFVVPAGECWDINQVLVNFFTNNLADGSAIEITFYDDNAGLPGTIVSSYVASPSDFTTTYVGTNYGLDVHAFLVNINPANLCGGAGGTTYWFTAKVINTTSSFYWECTYFSTYGANSASANTEAGPWTFHGFDFVFELFQNSTTNLTMTECDGFSIVIGSNTYNTSGIFQEVLTNMNGCDSIVNLDLTIVPAASGTDVITSCEPYLWIDGNTYSISNNTATHVLVGASVNGCDSTVTLDLTINSIDNGVTQTGQMLLSADEVGAAYQWLDCDNAFMPIAAATNQSYTSLVIGNFAVEVTANGCVDTSVCINVDFSSVDENENSSVVFYPNPVQNVIYFNGISELSGFVKMEVVSVTGAVVSICSNVTNSLDVSQLSEGIYFINIYHDGGIEALRFIKE